MDFLNRPLAPFGADVWAELEGEARRALRHRLVARRLVDFRGPLGWETASVPLGRLAPIEGGAPPDGVSAGLRQSQPLVELRVDVPLPRAELDAIARGADDADLDPLAAAASRLAAAEDHAVFHGLDGACIRGLVRGAGHDALEIPSDYGQYPRVVAEALDRLDRAGVEGPYALALGPRCWVGLVQASSSGGFPVLDHVRRLVEDRIVRAPRIDGAVVTSARGGDFELVIGQDASLGYAGHDAERVHLFLVETMTFRLVGPEAVVPLRYPG